LFLSCIRKVITTIKDKGIAIIVQKAITIKNNIKNKNMLFIVL
jgi:hypothetical protein